MQSMKSFILPFTVFFLLILPIISFAQTVPSKEQQAEAPLDEWIENLVEDTEDVEVENNTQVENLSDYMGQASTAQQM